MADEEFQGALPYRQPDRVVFVRHIDPPDQPRLEAALIVGATYMLLPVLMQFVMAIVFVVGMGRAAPVRRLPPNLGEVFVQTYAVVMTSWIGAVYTNFILLGLIGAASWSVARKSWEDPAVIRFLCWMGVVIGFFVLSIFLARALQLPDLMDYSYVGNKLAPYHAELSPALFAIVALLSCWVGSRIKRVGPDALWERLRNDSRRILGPIVLGLVAGFVGGLAWGVLQTLKDYETVMVGTAVFGYAAPFGLLGAHVGGAVSLKRLFAARVAR